MFVSVRSRGWKSAPVDAKLEATNLLVGPNGSGKSSVLDSLRLAAYGEVPGIGKQNQALMSASSDNTVEAVVDTNAGEVGVRLERKSNSVSRSNTGDQLKTSLPLSVQEFQGLTAAETRKLMSVGDDRITREQFKQDILETAGKKAKHAMSLFKDQGSGSIEDVVGWIDEISLLAKTQASNLRETEAALANTRKLIAESDPVPQGVINQWKSQVDQLRSDLQGAEKKQQVIHHLSDNVRRDRQELEQSQGKIAGLSKAASDLDIALKGCKKLKRACDEINTDKLAEIEKRISDIAGTKDESARVLAERKNFTSLLDSAVAKIGDALKRQELPKGKAEKVLEAIDILERVSLSIPRDTHVNEDDQDEINAEAESLASVREGMRKPIKDLEAALWAAGVSTLESLEKRAADSVALYQSELKNVGMLKEKLHESESLLGEDNRDTLDKQISDIKVQMHELGMKISSAQSTAALKGAEADLVSNAEVFREASGSSKAALAAAVEVQAEYLDRPVKSMQSSLDEFCEHSGLPKVQCQFVRSGRSISLEVYAMIDGKRVPLDTLSGGERLIVGCAFLYGLNLLHKPSLPLILVEAAELDEVNRERLLDGLLFAGSNGIQSITTSFVPVVKENLNLIYTGQFAEA